MNRTQISWLLEITRMISRLRSYLTIKGVCKLAFRNSLNLLIDLKQQQKIDLIVRKLDR